MAKLGLAKAQRSISISGSLLLSIVIAILIVTVVLLKLYNLHNPWDGLQPPKASL